MEFVIGDNINSECKVIVLLANNRGIVRNSKKVIEKFPEWKVTSGDLGKVIVMTSPTKYIATLVVEESTKGIGQNSRGEIKYVDYDAFFNSVVSLRNMMLNAKIDSISFQAESCDGDWAILEKMISRIFEETKIYVEICQSK